MNKKSTSIVRNPILNDFIYTILYNASYSQKRGLMGKYLKACMNQRSAKKFVTHSTRDEKEYIMSHLGYEFYYVVAKKGMTYESMKDILEQFDTNKTLPAMSSMAGQGLFVMGNTEFIRMMGLMSKTINHPSFFMNLEMQRQGYHIQKWGKRVNIDEDLAARELDESARIFARTAMNANLAMEYAPANTGVNRTSMKIILYMYATKKVEIAYDDLFAHFIGYLAPTEFKYGIKELLGGDLIHKTKPQVYSISGLGMKAVNDFLNSIQNLNSLC